MATASPSPLENDMPADQREAAAHARPNPNEPATQAEAGTPQYGSFGKPSDVDPATPRSGANDNPDEFSEFRKDNPANTTVPKPDKDVPGAYVTDSPNANPTDQVGHVVQNRDPHAVKMAQGDVAGQSQKDEDNTREAWAQDDERYAGGHKRASWTEQNDTEHDPNDNQA